MVNRKFAFSRQTPITNHGRAMTLDKKKSWQAGDNINSVAIKNVFQGQTSPGSHSDLGVNEWEWSTPSQECLEWWSHFFQGESL